MEIWKLTEKFSSLKQLGVIKKVRIAMLCAICGIIWNWAVTISKPVLNVLKLGTKIGEEVEGTKIGEEVEGTKREYYAKIVEIMTSGDVVSISGSLNLMYSQLAGKWIDFTICKQNWKYGLESIQQIEERIQVTLLGDADFEHKKHWIDYLLNAKRERKYNSEKKSCYSEKSWLNTSGSDSFIEYEWWNVISHHVVVRESRERCGECHVDNAIISLSVNIGERYNLMKYQLLLSIFSQILWPVFLIWMLLFLNEYIEKKLIELQEAKDETLRSVEARENSLINITHEIRTPLSAIIWFADLLSNTDLKEEQREYLRSIFISSEYLLWLINGILDYAKLEAWKMKLEQIDVNIWELLNKINIMLDVIIKQKSISFDWKIDRNVMNFFWDPTRIIQVLINIISNAIKFTPIWWNVSIKCFIKELEWNWEFLIIRVEDTWIWMDKDAIKMIFNQYAQWNVSIARTYWWTWLWISISKRLVELMWGNIRVESTFWKWSVFTISIPYIPAKEEVNEKLKEEVEVNSLYLWVFNTWRSVNKPFSEIVVCIVDDQQDNLIIMKSFLKKIWVLPDNIISGKNWEEAINLLNSWNKKANILFCDENMSWISWMEVASKIRSEWHELVIISWSANSEPKHLEGVNNAGMDGYLVKPTSLDSLWKLLKLLNVS